jgi:hypothetical protein
MKNIKSVKRLISQGINEKEAIYAVNRLNEIGLSPESITKKMQASEIIEQIKKIDEIASKAQ